MHKTQRLSKSHLEPFHNYSYDENYQLKTATNPEGGAEFGSEVFNYDSLGNRINDQLGAYAYDLKKQRLVEDHQNFYSYDNNGNLVTKSRKGMNGTSVNYIYSSDNQLVEVQFFENYLAVKNVFYRYDALGRRTQRTVVHATNPSAPVSRVWVYDGSEMIAEHDGELNHLATYTQSTMRTDDTLAVRVTSAGVSAGLAQASGTYNYLKDTLGSVAAVTDNAGNLVQRYVYSSFGKIISIKDETANDVTANAPLKTAYAYTNREWDEEIGLYYYRLRYYDQNVGRFLSEDPDGGKVANPETFKSRYTYVQNNPIYFIDPTGAVAEVKFSFGGVKFSSSWKSIALYIANPYAAIPKLFLKGKDSDRYDNVVMASYVVAAAFALSPASAAVALSSVVISNIGREDQGNFFDSLDDYSIQFLVTFSISELSGGPDMSGDPVLREIGTNIAARLLFDSIERTYGVGTLNTVKAGLFIAFPGRRIYQNFNSPYPYFVTIPLIERNYR